MSIPHYTPYTPPGIGIYPPSAPIALLASTPWEASKFTMELYYQGCVQVAPLTFDLALGHLGTQLRGMVFSAWFVDKDLMVMPYAWLDAVANTLILSGGPIITFDREKLRVPDNL